MELLFEYMNRHLLVVKGSSVSYILEKKDKYDRMEKYITYKSKKDFRENWEEYTITNKYVFEGTREAVILWLKWFNRRAYDEIVFRPYKHYEYDVDNYNKYNMWSGWEYEYDMNFKVDEDLIKNILHHMRVVVCNNNIEMYNYTLNLWNLILHGKKTGIGLGLTGIQGCGKSTILEYFGRRILGDKYFAYIQSLDDLTNKFSSLRCMKSFIICDELDTWGGDTATANKLKSILTQTVTKLEKKNKDAINVEDFSNYGFIANYRYPLRVEGKHDRRYLLQECNMIYTGNKEYFNRLNRDMGSAPLKGKLTKKEKIRARLIGKHFFHFLMNRDMSEFDTRNIPQTKILQTMKAAATPVIALFFYYFIEYLKFTKLTEIKVTAIYDLYGEFCNGLDYEVKFTTHTTFSKKCKKEFAIYKKYVKRRKKKITTFAEYSLDDLNNCSKKIYKLHTIGKNVIDFIEDEKNEHGNNGAGK